MKSTILLLLFLFSTISWKEAILCLLFIVRFGKSQWNVLIFWRETSFVAKLSSFSRGIPWLVYFAPSPATIQSGKYAKSSLDVSGGRLLLQSWVCINEYFGDLKYFRKLENTKDQIINKTFSWNYEPPK
jgi:hypothetical protein